MPSLETTNWILAIIAAASAAQFLMFLIGALWVAKRVAALQDAVTKTMTRFESQHLPALTQQATQLTAKSTELVHDLRKVAERMDRIGQEVERGTKIAHGALGLATAEVERATRGVRLALDVVEGGVRQAARLTAGLGAGLHELFSRRTNGRERVQDEDAVARFEAGA